MTSMTSRTSTTFRTSTTSRTSRTSTTLVSTSLNGYLGFSTKLIMLIGTGTKYREIDKGTIL